MVEHELLDFLMKEGVEDWNLWRIMDSSPPNLSECDFVEAWDYTGRAFRGTPLPLAGVDFSWADLTGSNLSKADLEGAHFQFANLKNAKFGEANLRNANLSDSDMRGAYLVGADLSGADLNRADIRDAQLRGCRISGANLVDANKAGANFLGTPLWEAALGNSIEVSPEEVISDDPVMESVNSIHDFIGLIKQLEELYGRSEASYGVELYFRGEPECEWELRPSVMREGFKKFESAMLLELTSRRPQDFNQTGYALADWVLAQHHTLRTRFLDLTKNPLVALFFACDPSNDASPCPVKSGRIHIFAVPNTMVKPFNSDTVSIITNFAKLANPDKCVLLGERNDPVSKQRFLGDAYQSAMNRLLQLIRTEKPYFDARIDASDFSRVIIVNPQHSPERIKAQSGAFLASVFHERFERPNILDRVKHAEAFGWKDKIPAYGHHVLTIRGESKSAINDDLKRLNVSRETLFPGLDESAKAVTEFYSEKRDTEPQQV